MNKSLRIVLSVALSLLVLSASADGKKDIFNPVNASVTSQTIAPDARAAGMGDVGVATDADVVSQYWNPAKYPFAISRAGVALNYTPWLRQLVSDMDLAYLAGYYRIGDYSAVSGSLRYFSLGEVFMNEQDATNTSGPAMTIRPYEMSVDVAYSLMLSEKFSIAAALRWIYSDLTYNYKDDTTPGSAFAADIAAYYQNYVNLGNRECQLGLGLNISNIGSKISFDGGSTNEFIPTNLRLGASLIIPIDEYNRFTIAADANKLLVPTYPTEDQYRKHPTKTSISTIGTMCRRNTTTGLPSAASSRVSAMLLAVSRKRCRKCSGASVVNTCTTTSSPCVPAITTRVPTRATASISPSVRASR